MPTLATNSDATADSQPTAAPAARVTTSWTSRSEAKPSASEVNANEARIIESRRRCSGREMDEVGQHVRRVRQEDQPGAADREELEAGAVAPVRDDEHEARTSGTQASVRFQTR